MLGKVHKATLAGLVFYLCVVSGATGQSYEPHDVFATFVDPEGEGHIQITDCGDGTPCGTITWLEPVALFAEEGKTPENYTTLDGRPVLGLQVLEGFKRKRKDWRGGTIYLIKEDDTFPVRIKRPENGDLYLKGCIAVVLCQTEVWPLVPDSTEAALAE